MKFRDIINKKIEEAAIKRGKFHIDELMKDLEPFGVTSKRRVKDLLNYLIEEEILEEWTGGYYVAQSNKH